ncbi:hypothetical protein HDU83_000352 [Entophlyctis luteolus]|nr:hypothetical protein HDU83_000352 [Entophlyctis luteolus]
MNSTRSKAYRQLKEKTSQGHHSQVHQSPENTVHSERFDVRLATPEGSHGSTSPSSIAVSGGFGGMALMTSTYSYSQDVKPPIAHPSGDTHIQAQFQPFPVQLHNQHMPLTMRFPNEYRAAEPVFFPNSAPSHSVYNPANGAPRVGVPPVASSRTMSISALVD